MTQNFYYNFNQLALKIKQLGQELGFDQVGIANLDLSQETSYLKKWLQTGFQGKMHYLEKNINLREHPELLLPDTVRIICCSINYPKTFPSHPLAAFAQLPNYTTNITDLLKKYAEKISAEIDLPQKTRVFSGHAPISEKSLATKAGIGWCGKNSLLVNNTSGSYFFLGEILINLPLPIDQPTTNRCGNCSKCIDQCPTKAIVAPHQLDARRCIAYLTAEYHGVIPLELRPLIGTKIFGCDACQQACPWNRFAKNKSKNLFTPLPYLTSGNLIEWFLWDKKEFLEKTKGTPVERITHERWLRNIAIALGNSPATKESYEALQARLNHPSALVKEHVKWALEVHLKSR